MVESPTKAGETNQDKDRLEKITQNSLQIIKVVMQQAYPEVFQKPPEKTIIELDPPTPYKDNITLGGEISRDYQATGIINGDDRSWAIATVVNYSTSGPPEAQQLFVVELDTEKKEKIETVIKQGRQPIANAMVLHTSTTGTNGFRVILSKDKRTTIEAAEALLEEIQTTLQTISSLVTEPNTIEIFYKKIGGTAYK